MKIALFGGSFDPPHLGHDKIVKEALKVLNLDKLIVMPTFINPFKNGFFAPPTLRLNWCKKLWQNLDNVLISDYEILQNHPVSTIQSVKFLYSKFKIDKFYLIIGEDNLKDLNKWHKFDELCGLVEFVVASRNEVKIKNLIQILPLKKLNINVNISSTEFRQNLNKDFIPNSIKSEVINFYKDKKMEKKLETIKKVLEDKKAENIEIINMRNEDYIAKYVVIATTLTGKHGLSLTDDLDAALKPLGEEFLGVEASDEWSVIDLGDVIIHLMSESHRAKYDIEELLAKLKKKEN